MSIIQKDGGLSVDWAPKDVTWQSVLQAARAANSKQGGWNSQSYWVERGLNRLVSFGQAQAFLQEWTKQTIDALASPAPRIEPVPRTSPSAT